MCLLLIESFQPPWIQPQLPDAGCEQFVEIRFGFVSIVTKQSSARVRQLQPQICHVRLRAAPILG